MWAASYVWPMPIEKVQLRKVFVLHLIYFTRSLCTPWRREEREFSSSFTPCYRREGVEKDTDAYIRPEQACPGR